MAESSPKVTNSFSGSVLKDSSLFLDETSPGLALEGTRSVQIAMSNWGASVRKSETNVRATSSLAAPLVQAAHADSLPTNEIA